ncbi:MAG: LPS export ABC transporter periplasmic protein LptC [Spirochaetaceae bacterium]|nr:LPS export ABC transporter periplasmic protein LptC [Spirochaetaceae bacterium]
MIRGYAGCRSCNERCERRRCDSRLRSRRRFLVVLVLVVLLPGFLSSCSIGEEEETESVADKGQPDVIFYNFSREEIENGVVVFTARAEKAEYFEDQGILFIYNIHFENRGKTGGKPIAIGEADKAIYHEDSGDVEFQNYVQIQSVGEDASFEAKELRYNAASQTIEGGMDDPVIAKVGRDLFFYGSGFFADIEGRAFSFRNGVQGTMLEKH